MTNPEPEPAPSPESLTRHPNLFRHVYDIDTLITAFCGTTASTLNTGNGTFTIEPLPISYLAEALHHRSFSSLDEPTQREVRKLTQSTSLSELLPHFTSTPAGHWLRERIKEAVLEWLDSHDLIPPSMKHVTKQAPRPKATTGKVSII